MQRAQYIDYILIQIVSFGTELLKLNRRTRAITINAPTIELNHLHPVPVTKSRLEKKKRKTFKTYSGQQSPIKSASNIY